MPWISLTSSPGGEVHFRLLNAAEVAEIERRMLIEAIKIGSDRVFTITVDMEANLVGLGVEHYPYPDDEVDLFKLGLKPLANVFASLTPEQVARVQKALVDAANLVK